MLLSLLRAHFRVGEAALVCTRWRELTHSVPLLRTIEARIRGSPVRTLSQAATSFCDWFYDWAAPHAQRLNVVLPYDYGPYDAPFNDVVFAMDELSGTLDVVSAERGCRLQDLRISHCFEDHDWVSGAELLASCDWQLVSRVLLPQMGIVRASRMHAHWMDGVSARRPLGCRSPQSSCRDGAPICLLSIHAGCSRRRLGADFAAAPADPHAQGLPGLHLLP